MGMDYRTEYILGKLHKIFKDGYRPSRKRESYFRYLRPNLQAKELVNCLGHACFNLRNKQFIDYDIEYDGEFYFGDFDIYPNNLKSSANEMLDFIREVGLKVEECKPNAIIKDFKSWKIALYFKDDFSDYHFMLEYSPLKWSAKNGNEPKLDIYRQPIPPKEEEGYKFFGTYKITNKNADEKNRYVNLKIER